MIRVYINGTRCTVDASTQIALSYDGDTTTDLNSAREEQAVAFKIPLSGDNTAIFGIAGDIHPATKFNAEGYAMSIEADGIELFAGRAYLTQVVWEQGARYAIVECRSDKAIWATAAAETLFSKIAIEYNSYLNQNNIEASWSNDSVVKFFPIVRDEYVSEGTSTDVTGVRILRSIDDYHPFISLTALLEAIFSASGYSYQSTTALEESFDEIYISGDYSSAENEAAREAMGFYAKRAADVTTTTDSLGRVAMSPYNLYSTVGNIIDLSTVESDTECYNYSGVLQYDNQAVIFRPTTQISAGFEYYLHYTCQCEVESRTKLKGIDTLSTISNGDIEWEITNRYVDYRDSPSSGMLYTLIIFDFTAGETFDLYGLYGESSKSFIRSINSRITTLTIPASYFSSLQLYIASGSGYVDYTKDWALYSGYVTGLPTTEVKITVRSSPALYSPTSPMEFELQLLKGAAADAEFTLHSDSSVRPYFAAYPGYNAAITFEDVAQHSFSALDLLSSIQHLFNMRFVTNEAAKEVTFESFDRFYTDGEFDWSDKIIQSEEVKFVDVAHSKNRYNKLGYQQTDGVVVRLGESDNKYFGQWSYTVDSFAASSSERTDLNAILCATTSGEDGVMIVGDRDDIDTVDSLSFSPRIARYFELVEVEGENYSLPLVAFHAPERDFTLCFEDRDGVQGLNRLFASEVATFARAQKIALSLRLSAYDYSNLFAPSPMSPSLRSIFCFEIHGESFRTILHSVESYNPATGVARCIFTTLD